MQVLTFRLFRLFQPLYEADRGLFEIDNWASSNEDQQQFIQEELRTSANTESLTVDIDMFDFRLLNDLIL